MPSARLRPLLLPVALILIVLLTLLAPQERSLGANVRLVYLHGAWVLTAELAFFVASVTGALGLLLRREGLHRWSAALGRTGILLWITYLPLALWTMQANWNGLFLAEPRFRLALIFAVTGALLQAGLWLVNTAWLTSLGNLLFFLILRLVFGGAEDVMHPPPSPIFSSGDWNVIAFFVALNLLTWLVAYLVARLFLRPAAPAE